MEVSKRDSLSSIGSTDEKKRRTRRRKLHAGLCSQVEFYFSDANLRKDRFLNQEISKSVDRFVPLAMVASFNKIRTLTDDIGVIAKALQKSKLVEVSPDETKLRRIKPLEEPKYDPDDCTVYVECLPKTADIAWIQKTFKYCGKVVYVSIPRYKSTGDIKGFAFVEYETPEEAQRACQLLNNPLDDYGPPGMFPKTRKGKFVSIDSSQMYLSQDNEAEGFDNDSRRRHRKRSERCEDARESKKEEVTDDQDNEAKGFDNDSRRRHRQRSERCEDARESKKEEVTDDQDNEAKGFDNDSRRRHRQRSERGEDARESKKEEMTDDHSGKHLKRRHHDDVDDGKDGDSKRLKTIHDNNSNDESHRERRVATKSKHERGIAENEENRKKPKRRNKIAEDEDEDGKKEKGPREDDHVKEKKEDERPETIERKDSEGGREEDNKKTRKRKTEDDDDCQKKRKHKEDEETEVFVKASKQKDESSVDVQKDIQETLKKLRNAKPVVKERKESRKKKKRFRQKKEMEEQQLFLRVLSKAEWLKLKEQYLHLQRAGLQEMKNAMRAQWRGVVNNHTKKTSQAKPAAKPSITQEAPRLATAPEFIQGVVLRIQSTEPIESRKDLREKLDTAAPVAYVDLEDGDTGGFVRFKFQQAAEKILSQDIDGLDAISFTLLTGDEEKKYWQKLNADRENKLTSNIKRKKKRGKIRVIKRAERAVQSKTSSHITFNDEDG